MKKTVKVLLALALVITCIYTVSMQTKAATVASGTCGANGGNLTWSLNDAGTLTISGSGAMKDFDYASHYHVFDAPWTEYCERIKQIVIKKGVTTIGSSAFFNCAYVTDITIPKGVTSIGDDAFLSCYRLTSVTLPDSLRTIGSHAFSMCYALSSITIPNSVTTIGNDIFSNCSSLKSVALSNSITTISDYMFFYCENLTSVTIPKSVTTIGKGAFQVCSGLTSLTIPEGVTTIGDSAFFGCAKMTTLTIPSSIASIGINAFVDCDSLIYKVYNNGKYLGNNASPYVAFVSTTNLAVSSCNIHPNTKLIYHSAFSYCNNLSSVTIPNKVTTIGRYAFAYCDNLRSVIIGNHVTALAKGMFNDCPSLTTVTIPDSVTEIGVAAFSSCRALQTIYYDGTRTQWQAIHIDSGDYFNLINVTIYYNSFPDVKLNAWYYNAVEFAVEKGYFSGHGNGNFAPSDPITRQDFVLVLSRIAGADLTGYTGVTAFADVPCSASYTPYYAKAIQWATENGIINGYDPDINGVVRFGVGDKLTREQLVTIMYRYAKKLGVDVTVTTGWDLMATYPDAIAPNPNMKEMVAWALENGVISGKQVNGKTCIAPQASASRAETAQILMNISTKGIIPGI